MSYPQKTRDKLPWWVVIKTKPRFRVDNQYMFQVAYQEDNISNVNAMADHDVSIQNLRYDVGHYEDIDVNILDVSEAKESEEKENNDEEEEVKAEDEEFEDFISDEDEEFEDFISNEDEELAIGDMSLDDNEDKDKYSDLEDEKCSI